MPVVVDGENGITFPNWTTATRPINPNVGQTGFNTTIKQLEKYNGTTWVPLIGMSYALSVILGG